MRILALCLLVGAAFAQDEFAAHKKAFDDFVERTLDPAVQPKVGEALDALAGTGDVRAVGPIAAFVAKSIVLERQLKEESTTLQQKAAKDAKRIGILERELEFLQLKEKAGDTKLGPEIDKRVAARDELAQLQVRLQVKVADDGRAVEFLTDVRARAAKSCSRILAGLEGAQAGRGLAAAHTALDVADREQALHLVTILADSSLPQAEAYLLGVLTHPKADDAVRLRAQMALARGLSRRGAETLLRLWENDPDNAGESARHVLSRAARRRFASVEEARAWIETLD